MTRIPWNSKDVRGDIDISDSDFTGPEVTRLGEWSTSRRELWGFYLYYLGNNGLSRFNFGTSQFRNLLYLAGYDPSQPPFAKPCGSGSTIGCYTIWDTSAIVFNSIILLTNGIRFAIQAVLLLMIGAWADYGTWSVQDPSQWPAGACSFAFWFAALPGLVRNLPEVQASADEAKKGLKPSLGRLFSFESLARNCISNISLTISSVGEVLILAIMIGILKVVKSDRSVENNTKAFNVLLAFSGGVWCSFPRRLLYAIVHLIH
ncbi:hypothetical protein DFH94DRAFT_709504 [Russula ochroleuca]|uniref:Autophagy-related protein n=1 Tax=Russula ochroleuca TaxID=152965 RepID=A0A9P5N4G5_9AGAM|nr:hypothetical protein DFH94DRAFT_709504 [Russula ochroleuca]